MVDFKNKTVLITGASRGIGFAVAQAFEKEQALLILTARQNTELLTRFKNAVTIKADLTDKQDIDAIFQAAIATSGRIDFFINNAAIFKQTPFEEIREDELDAVIDIDFKGPFLLLQKIFAQMKQQHSGKIITLASGAGKLGSSKASHYAACKAALINLTKSLAKAGGPYNINVNAVAPGFIKTEMIEGMLSEKKDFIKSLIPLGRVGSADEVARVILFLASSAADYITGQTICVDGGHCMV